MLSTLGNLIISLYAIIIVVGCSNELSIIAYIVIDYICNEIKFKCVTF